MPARTPVLGTASNPFGVSSYAFGAFNLGTGADPTQQALTDAANARYEVSVRYGNGQATTDEYMAAIAAERAISERMLGSVEQSVRDAAQKHIVELDNLSHDLTNHSREVTANAVDDNGEALLAVYQDELSQMTAGSTGYTEKQAQITSLQKSIDSSKQADLSRQASYELATAHNAWTNGQLSDSDYEAAYAKYADAQKPGTAEWENAHSQLTDLRYSIDRNVLVNQVNAHTKTMDDLLAFDKAHLDSQSGNQSSDGYRSALSTYQSTQKAAFQLAQQATDTKYQAQQMTSAQALDWYKQQLVGRYADNPDIVDAINQRITTLNANVQSDRDAKAINDFNHDKMSPTDFLAYAKARAAAYPVGTQDHQDWLDRADQAKTAAVQPALQNAYAMSQQYISLQKFIADNSAPPTGGTTTKIVIGADGQGHLVTSSTPPTAAEQEAWKQRQAEVADAKVQLAQLGQQIAGTTTGFVSSQQMLAYWQQQQATVVKGSPQWYTFQGQIDTVNGNIHAEALLAGSGIKVSYPELTASGVSGGKGASAPKGGSVSAGIGTGSTAVPKGSVAKPGGATFGGLAGGNYSPAELDYVANRLSQLTGLSPAAARVWAQKEQGGGNNPFGVSGKGTAGNSGIRANFNTIDEGIAAAASWINTHPNMAGIKAAVGKSDAAQIAAIDASPWGPGGNKGGYNGSLIALANRTGMPAPTSKPGKSIDGTVNVDDFLRGLGQQVSSGDYTTRNSKTGAFGKYQILPGNWTAWAAKYLGDATAAPTPENQDRVAKAVANDMHTQLGSWQAVAHWWLTGGTDARVNADPSKWGATDSQFVNNVMRYAGGVVVGGSSHLPVAPRDLTSSGRYVVPTTAISLPRGLGAPSGLQAIVPGTTKKDAKSGLTTQKTVPIDFPPTMTIGQFDQLYTSIHTAIFAKGAVSYTYKDGNGNSINILLPDNPQGRAALVNSLDSSRIQLAQAQAVAYAGTSQEAAAQSHYSAVVKQAGQNQLSLLDTEYGGKYPKGSDMANLARGLGAAPAPKGQAGSKTNPLLGSMTKAGKDEALTAGQYTGIQTNSLNPVAAGDRTLDYAKAFIATQTQLAQDAWDHGRTNDAIIHLTAINDATGQFGQLSNQIAVYGAQSKGAVGAITDATGADISPAVAKDIARLDNGGQAELDAARAPADKLLGEIKPFLKTTASGDIVRDGASGTVVLKSDSIWLASQNTDGSIKLTRTKLLAGAYPDSQTANPNQPTPGTTDAQLVQVTLPTEAGSTKLITDAYTKFHVGVIGYFTDPNGNRIPVNGRILDIPNPDGSLIVENPFQQGKWAPGPIFFSTPPGTVGVQLVPATDAKGQPLGSGATAIQFNGKDGVTYKMTTDPKTGQMNVTGLGTDAAGQPNVRDFGQANQGDGARITQSNGVGNLDLGKNSPTTVGFLTTTGINGPWSGMTLDDAYRTQFGPRAALYGQQQVNDFANAASKLLTDPAGQITKFLQGVGNGPKLDGAQKGSDGLWTPVGDALNLGNIDRWPWTPQDVIAAPPPPAPVGDVRKFIGPPAPQPPGTWDHGTADLSAPPPPPPPVVTNPYLPAGSADTQYSNAQPVPATLGVGAGYGASKPLPTVASGSSVTLGAGAGVAPVKPAGGKPASSSGTVTPSKTTTLPGGGVQATATLPPIKSPPKTAPTPPASTPQQHGNY